MQIVHNSEKATLVSENEFTKVFKVGEVELYFSKAYDDESNKHFVVVSIKEIAELNVQHLQYPFVFDTEETRDSEFANMNIDFVSYFLNYVREFIKEQQKKNEEQSKS